jgi:hypothetical protein
MDIFAIKNAVTVSLKRYDTTDLERLLGKEFDYQNRTIWEDAQQTYYDTISELGHTSIKIKTNLIPPKKNINFLWKK